MSLKRPLVVILGATGSGKTRLSLELAQRFGGEIISADSMQVYKGLDLITAKATTHERSLIPHHVIDFLPPHHQNFTVLDFRNKALPIINGLLESNKLPVVVGGTNYYIESILWKILVEEPGKSTPFVLPPRDLTSIDLHRKLLESDPDRANQLHPNNKRKILRSLEILEQKGRKHSEILEEQRASEGGSSLGGGLRYSNALVFWLQCDQEVLNGRLDSRVDTMINQGLVDELLDFHEKYNEARVIGAPADYTTGVFQSIGFKEFHDYLLLDKSERVSETGCLLFNKSVDELKLVTRRYARKQKRWIRNRLLNKNRLAPLLYGLDTTDLNSWDENVKQPAFTIVESTLEQKPSQYKPLQPVETQCSPVSLGETNVCEVCDRVFVDNGQWTIHLKSHKHRRVLAKKKKQA